jgi:uncharacterized protein (UPF0335 family)
MSADTIVKSSIDRILRLKEEQDSLAADIREVYAEAKGNGYDKTALGEVVSYLRKVEKKGKDACEERDAAFGMYLDAYERASSHTYAPARAREIIEEFDPETGEVNDTGSGQHVGRPDDKQRDEARVPGSVGRGEGDDESSQGQGAGVAGTDRCNGPVEGTGARQDQDGGGRHVGGEARHEINQSEGGAFVAVTGRAQLTNANSVEPSPSDAIPDDDVPAFLKKDRYVLRPHCLNPSLCAGSGREHCHACKRAMAESEAA